MKHIIIANGFYHDSTSRVFCISFLSHFALFFFFLKTGFIEKNNDRVSPHLIELMQCSDKSFVRGIFKPDVITPEGGAPGTPVNRRRSMMAKKPTAVTISSKFKSQLNNLYQTLLNTSPHYIRCIKPNKSKSSKIIESKMVLDQLLYSGVLETVDIRRQGFPFREEFKEFWYRMESQAMRRSLKRCLKGMTAEERSKLAEPEEIDNMPARQGCELLLRTVLKDEHWQLGKSKVFLKDHCMSTLMKWQQQLEVVPLQAGARRFLARMRYIKYRRAIIFVQRGFHRLMRWRAIQRVIPKLVRFQAHIRGIKGRKIAYKMRHIRDLSAIDIQKTWKGVLPRRRLKAKKLVAIRVQALVRCKIHHKRYQKVKSAVGKLQPFIRGHFARVRCRILRRLAAQRKRVARSQSFIRGYLARESFYRFLQKRKKSAIRIQASWRCYKARNKFRMLKNAISHLQAHFKGHRQRIATEERKEAIIRLQSAWKMYLGRRRFMSLQKAAISIQSWRRCQMASKDFRMQKRAVRRIERACFSSMCARRLDEWLEDAFLAIDTCEVEDLKELLYFEDSDYLRLKPLKSDIVNIYKVYRESGDVRFSSLLHAAVVDDSDVEERTEMVDLLLSFGANISAPNHINQNPIFLSSKFGDSMIECTRLMLESAPLAQVKRALEMKDGAVGRTVVDYLLFKTKKSGISGYEETLELLSQHIDKETSATNGISNLLSKDNELSKNNNGDESEINLSGGFTMIVPEILETDYLDTMNDAVSGFLQISNEKKKETTNDDVMDIFKQYDEKEIKTQKAALEKMQAAKKRESPSTRMMTATFQEEHTLAQNHRSTRMGNATGVAVTKPSGRRIRRSLPPAQPGAGFNPQLRRSTMSPSAFKNSDFNPTNLESRNSNNASPMSSGSASGRRSKSPRFVSSSSSSNLRNKSQSPSLSQMNNSRPNYQQKQQQQRKGRISGDRSQSLTASEIPFFGGDSSIISPVPARTRSNTSTIVPEIGLSPSISASLSSRRASSPSATSMLLKTLARRRSIDIPDDIDGTTSHPVTSPRTPINGGHNSTEQQQQTGIEHLRNITTSPVISTEEINNEAFNVLSNVSNLSSSSTVTATTSNNKKKAVSSETIQSPSSKIRPAFSSPTQSAFSVNNNNNNSSVTPKIKKKVSSATKKRSVKKMNKKATPVVIEADVPTITSIVSEDSTTNITMEDVEEALKEMSFLEDSPKSKKSSKRILTSADNKILEEGKLWKEHSTGTGQLFYHNPETGKTTWFKPHALLCLEAERQGEIWPVKREWVAMTSSDGQVYYYNPMTGENRWDNPEEEEDNPTQNPAQDPAHDAAQTESSIKKEPETTTSSTIERQPEQLEEDVDIEKLKQQQQQQQQQQKQKQQRQQRESNCDWSEVKSAQGDVFFVNAKTGEKRWSRPMELGGTQNEWMAFKTDSGDTYYYNEDSKQTVWTLPDGATVANVN
eukprot:TRINITY_DN185_c0_g1_i1.p1 TRINITY_DN185_c0_g1~~TRINITY_DN185_c0_g1_i1.p1  ORF type:complete len:1456 (-),score=503.08 TRINITY_DN185_c0_g1_i1:793-5160(-)